MPADFIALVFWAALAVAAGAAIWYRLMRQRCPECVSWVDNRAVRCKHCGAELG